MQIPTESRATMLALRAGRTEKQFLAEIWSRRAAENPAQAKQAKPRGKWPQSCRTPKGFVLPDYTITNVTPIGKRKKA